MSTALGERPRAGTAAGTPDGGVPARRAVIRWAWRLFRREWRQQLLILALLTVAVAATVWGAGVATNTPPPDSDAGTFGTAPALISLPGSDPHLAADIAAIQRRYRPAEVIENQALRTGAAQPVQLRAQDPSGPYGRPMLALVSGRYPSGPGQVAMTSQVASLYGVHTGDVWHADGTAWRITGIVENPASLLDEFALVAPGQVTAPTQVTILTGAQNIGRLPAAASLSYRPPPSGGIPPATIVLVVAVLGLVFIGLVAVAGFTVMAQRRLRALGMLSALGATEENVRLVMVANGAAVGVIAAVTGAAIGFGAWFAYVPHLQTFTAHTVDPLNLPWWAIALAVVLAVVTAVVAARQPARAVARTPVVAALSGRPVPPKIVNRSAVLGTGLIALGVFFLVFSGGWGGNSGGDTLLLLVGLVAIIVGMSLLAPLCVATLTAAAGPRAPVAVRIALRDVVRYRARSGAALAAVCFAVFLAMLICIIASVRFSKVLDWTGPNLTSSQLIVSTPYGASGPGTGAAPTQAQLNELHAKVEGFAASLHAQAVVALDEAGTFVSPSEAGQGNPSGLLGATMTQAGTRDNNFSGRVYVATPELLAEYGIKPGQINPATDILTMRPGLASLPSMYLIWGRAFGQNGSFCPAGNCVASPPMQTFSSLPGGTSAPNTVLTMQAVRRLHLQLIPDGWLIQTPQPLTAAQISAARQLAVSAGVTMESKSGELGLSQISDGATALGILIALGVLVMTVGLVRSETARDLRTLTATGASGRTRRTITAATAGAIALLGAVLGTAAAAIAGLAWARSSLSTTFGDIPVADILLILVGLPVVAAVGGWLLAGREPPAVSRQPLD